ncbi:env protein [Simian immunodeficiency virus]|uniref:Envelope glycoprotein gp160 n=1 Tax=Simian immunodeficiency virus TaxID=11723 RepID=Q699U6_SIV|nr:env protein [Simian immunodeficiency virus]
MKLFNIISVVLGIVLSLGIVARLEQYVTVFYGVPNWEDAQVPMFCATPHTGGWATKNCVPSSEQIEVRVNISGEYFTAWNSSHGIRQQLLQDMSDLFLQADRPCVKLSPMCIRTLCVEDKDSSSGNLTTTISPTTTTNKAATPPAWWGDNSTETRYNCSFNMTGGFKDKKHQYNAFFYKSDIMREEGNESYYYLQHCNTSVMRNACEKQTFRPFPIQYCAPPGYSLLKCNDTEFEGDAECQNVTAVSCTHPFNTLASTWFQLNGTYKAKDKVRFIRQKDKNESVIILVPEKLGLQLVCERPGNESIKNIQLAAGFFLPVIQGRLKTGKAAKRAFCKVKGEWGKFFEQVHNESIKVWKNVTSTSWRSQPQGDLEVRTHWFQCGGEFFYCNVSKIFANVSNGYANPSNYAKNLYLSCAIRQIINYWGYVTKLMYLPPTEGHIKCTSNITAVLTDIEYYPNSQLNFAPTANVEDVWRADLFNYKLIRIKPIGFAPTSQRRYELPTKQKRAAPLALGFLGLLSAAGTAMGSAATALTLQSQTLLAGIVQQQQKLLEAVEAQQHLLGLTVWGVKNLNARLTALETYLRDQAIMSNWGCAFKQICHTAVTWQQACGNNSRCPTPQWENMTWHTWERQVDNLTDHIDNLLREAQEQQEKNVHDLTKLQEWDSLWSWFDLSKWFQYLKIGFFAIAAIVILRVLSFAWGIVRNMLGGYSPLLQKPQPPTLYHKAPAGPEEGIETDTDNYKPSVSTFSREFLRQSLAEAQKLWNRVSESCRSLIRGLVIAWGFISYGVTELKEAAISLGREVAHQMVAIWQALLAYARRVAENVAALPRRLRQGLEIYLN